MSERVGFIGGGAMAEALITGFIAEGAVDPAAIVVSEPVEKRRETLSNRFSVRTTALNREVVAAADLIIVAVKPQHAAQVFAEVREVLTPGHLVVSIMAGVSTARIEAACPPGVRVIRVMPNVAARVKAAASAIALGQAATEQDEGRVTALLGTVGRVVTVEERMMDAVTGLSGSGPAYVFSVIEGLADGGVAEGLPRATALKLAAQTVLGAAQMMLATGEHPALLRESVTSPAGTTVEGLAVLEERGVRGAMASAVRAAADRSRRLGKESS